MGKRVVEGGPIRFEDDLPIVKEEIPKPLGLPPVPLLEDVLTVWYKGRFFQLEQGPGAACACIWGRTYGFSEAEPAASKEEAWARAHEPALQKAEEAWLSRVLAGSDPARSADEWGAQLGRAIRDRVLELCPTDSRPPRRNVGKGSISRSSEASVLAAMQGYDRWLAVDGKVYDLLSLGEYLARFEKAFEPEFFKDLEEVCDDLTPNEVCDFMKDGLDRMDKKTYGVIKGKVYYDRRTFQLALDGVYFIPEYLCRGEELLSTYMASMERTRKLGVLFRVFTT